MKRGRPPDSDELYFVKGVKRRSLARALHDGAFDPRLWPERLHDADTPDAVRRRIEACKGSWTEAHAVAAEILRESPSAVKQSRTSIKPMTDREFHGFFALIRRQLRRERGE